MWRNNMQTFISSESFKHMMDSFMVADHIDGLVQDCSNSIANALELLQSCSKPSIYQTTTKYTEYGPWP